MTVAGDVDWMQRAFALAARSLVLSDPNPRVGCVLVRDGGIVGEGWTQRAGSDHAEIQALARAGDEARGSTAYVTLEPCVHQGRTGPCAGALIEAGVVAVVVAVADPNPRVAGAGLVALAAAGMAVREDACGQNPHQHNPGYFKRWASGIPWVRVKQAASLDGRTALANGTSRWITGEEARADVQRWRARSSALLTGIGTVLADDPRLNQRPDTVIGHDADSPVQRQPLRVVVDSRLRTPPTAALLRHPGQVLLAAVEGERSDVEVLLLPGADDRVDLAALLHELGARGCNEVQVEAGPQLVGALLGQGLVDEVLLYIAPLLMGADARPLAQLGSFVTMEECMSLRLQSLERFGDDTRLLFEVRADDD